MPWSCHFLVGGQVKYLDSLSFGSFGSSRHAVSAGLSLQQGCSEDLVARPNQLPYRSSGLVKNSKYVNERLKLGSGPYILGASIVEPEPPRHGPKGERWQALRAKWGARIEKRCGREVLQDNPNSGCHPALFLLHQSHYCWFRYNPWKSF